MFVSGESIESPPFIKTLDTVWYGGLCSQETVRLYHTTEISIATAITTTTTSLTTTTTTTIAIITTTIM